nr:hypothetical protein P5652_07905 [Bacillus subtilis]
MNKYRVRLFSVFVVCMILVFCVLGLFLQQLFETSDQRKAEEHIEKEAKYLASLLDAGNLNNQANEKIIKDAGGALDVSASVIDTDGKVLYGSNGRSADSQKVQALVSTMRVFCQQQITSFITDFHLEAKVKKQDMCCFPPLKKATA